jgi:shikimate dehydrogenase
MNVYALIGFPLSHSFSEKYFTEKFKREGITNAVFKNFSIKNIDYLPEVLQEKNLKGIAVTIPYKKAVIPFLHKVSSTVRQIGACNCIRIENDKLIGFNTDVDGFERSFVKQLKPYHKNALILGTGGAAAAVEFVLKKLQINFRFVSRTGLTENNIFSYTDLDDKVMKEYTIIINCTPLGTYPKNETCPEIPYTLLTYQHYLFDLVYNPSKTKFLHLGEQQGATIQNGYEMLVLQAEENWRIWNE